MGSSLGLAAYRAYARRSAERGYDPASPRPEGTLLWIHAAEPANLLAAMDLARQVCAARFDLNVLVTLPDRASLATVSTDWQKHDRIHLDALPSEHKDSIRAFWRHWEPDMAIWSYGNLKPNLLHHVHKKECPIALIDGDEAGFDGRHDRWLPDLSRQLLDPFCALMVRSSGALRRLEALGLNTGRVNITTPLQAGGEVLPCADADLTDLSQTLSGRPLWLATHVQSDEFAAVVGAHRQAIRLSHRLLLILNPAVESQQDSFLQLVAQEGLRASDWTAGEEPDESTQVLLISDARELGLFYRLAPVTFMGSTLVQGHNGRNPFEAATLGSAVLYGPNVRHYMPFYSRLAKAGAARIVKDGETLGSAVSQLIAPDQAAAMAVAGWDVVSQGADLNDRVIELVHATLDGEAVTSHART